MLSIPYYYNSFSCFFTKIFRMTSFAPREAMTTAEQTEAYPISSLIKITYCQQTLQNHGRRLRGFLFLQCFQWTTKKSCAFV